MLNETKIELGPNGAKVTNTNGTVGTPADLPKNFYNTYKKAISYLRAKGLLAKIASKEDYSSEDLSFQGNGDVVVSFDGGGKYVIPSKVLDAEVPSQKKTGFLNGLKKQIAAACVDLNEDIDYFNY